METGLDPPPGSSSPSTTSSVLDSLLSSEKEVAARRAEMEGSQEPKTKKQRRSTQKKKLPTENHLKLRSLIDAYDDWEEKLKDKLRTSEIGLCAAIIMKYADRDSYPEDDPDENPSHMLLARPGWELFRAYKKFADQHPECINQTKHSGEWEILESSSPSTTSSVSDSLLSSEKEVAERKAEKEGYLASQEPKTKKQRRSTRKKKIPTENHLKLRSLIDAYDDWEEKLKDKLRTSEIGLCAAIIMKYADKDSYPEDDPDENPAHMLLARPGWELFRAYKKFADQHPECINQTKHSGEWEIL